MTALPRAKLSLKEIPGSIKKLERRLAELGSQSLANGTDWSGVAHRIVAAINATVDDVFGAGTADAQDFKVDRRWFVQTRYDANDQVRSTDFKKGLDRAKHSVADAIKRLNEWVADATNDDAARTLKAYEGLDLHPEVARVANDLYSNGHFANAVEDAVKALNAFVRLRSGVEDRDGTELMEQVFSVKNPVLAFNSLKDESDRNEQKGFMMMFSGAVAGLRNPRAHRLVRDDPERALEFIAFVSLLAKLVDGAKRVSGK